MTVRQRKLFCCCTGTLSPRELLAFYAIFVLLVIFNLVACASYSIQFITSQEHPITSVSMQELTVFPEVELLVVSLSTSFQDFNGKTGTPTSFDTNQCPDSYTVASLRSPTGSLDVVCNVTCRNSFLLKWVVIRIPLSFVRKKCDMGEALCGTVSQLHNHDVQCVEDKWAEHGHFRWPSAIPTMEIGACTEADRAKIWSMPRLDMDKLPISKLDVRSFFVLAVSPKQVHTVEHAIFQLSKALRAFPSIADAAAVLADSLTMRFPGGSVVALGDNGLAISSHEHRVETGIINTDFTVRAEGSTGFSDTHISRFGTWAIQPEMLVHISRQPIGFTIWNVFSSSFAILHMSIFVVKCLFPSRPSVPRFFAFGSVRNVYRKNLVSHVLKESELSDLSSMRSNSEEKGSTINEREQEADDEDVQA
eukprot:gnl/TRDRNA2_/TRDRNA2_126715_c0_seq1.p1 gnl/TRDRNA2_/TRDRNA2_126715_c0~~gnl/TRDRNA2_/TRDRNA2_126715_c0_seq1.p1  ORF type:complete len:420 (+),score=24.81 gnl/TRDRNA2_/TRDRNA2_126715_c0_seq1:57-1316(+)